MSIKDNVKNLLAELGTAELTAVTKIRSIAEIKEAIEAGAKIIGESRVQEAEEKYNELKDCLKENKVEFHFIGHLQSNKVKKAVEMLDMIQSVDSIDLAEEIDKRAKEARKVQKILVQVNIGKEPQKFGVVPEKTSETIEKLKSLKNINIKGLMCIAPYFEDPEKTRPYFREMKRIQDQLGLEILSMGMTNDYKIAIQEGSNMVRIGTGIFGERKY
ncbi:YggS family pyridoxal phosphate-dependent enzyme [Candidatus Woesearchaeota archaeon]|nr:YggS family pyridoxal phosphate-dependent enzyme [Candidatus Woesearchaeota archaeon]